MQEAPDDTASQVSPHRDWTRGNILHNLLRLSWPMVLGNTLTTVGFTVDAIWAGRLGT